MNFCLILLSCLVYSNDSGKINYSPCSIEVSKIQKVMTSEDGGAFINELGHIKESVLEVTNKVNQCKNSPHQ